MIGVLEIEKEILGMLFVSKQSAQRIIDELTEEHFTYEIHKKLFNAAKYILGKNQYFDLNLICNYLDWEDSMKVAEIHHFGITDANYEYYREIIQNNYFKRSIKGVDDIEHISEILDRVKINIANGDDIAKVNVRNLEEYIQNSNHNIYSPGWVEFPKYYKLSKGQVTIVTGIPSHGKSAFIDQIAMNLVDTYNWKVMYFSPENMPVEKHIFKIIRMKYGDREKLENKIEWVNKYYKFLDPSVERRDIKTILNNVEDCDLFVLDPWNELESTRPANMTETEYIGNALKLIKNTAIRKNCHIIIAAHPTKLIKNEKGQYPVPRPYDISGSANWLNKADICYSVYRPDEKGKLSNKTEIHIQKVRFQPENGQIGIVRFQYNNFRFDELV